MSKQLDAIMKPRAIAVVGASTKEHTIGSDIMKRAVESVKRKEERSCRRR